MQTTLIASILNRGRGEEGGHNSAQNILVIGISERRAAVSNIFLMWPNGAG